MPIELLTEDDDEFLAESSPAANGVYGAIDCCTDCTGELIINGQTMHTPAWCVTELLPLWMPSNIRGSNITLPGYSGRRALPKREDETQVSLPMVISGVVDRVGNRYTNPQAGLAVNVAFLLDAVAVPPDAPVATRTATLETPDGTMLTAEVQVNAINAGNRAGPLFLATLELIIPSGRFL